MEIKRVRERRREGRRGGRGLPHRHRASPSSNLPSRRHRTRLAQPHSARCRPTLPSSLPTMDERERRTRGERGKLFARAGGSPPSSSSRPVTIAGASHLRRHFSPFVPPPKPGSSSSGLRGGRRSRWVSPRLVCVAAELNRRHAKLLSPLLREKRERLKREKQDVREELVNRGLFRHRCCVAVRVNLGCYWSCWCRWWSCTVPVTNPNYGQLHFVTAPVQILCSFVSFYFNPLHLGFWHSEFSIFDFLGPSCE
ncbi:uncharacterized protein DS421_8g227650 [Arachis hypogaea]|nr:uncharacterized protein DS421_8g227650 [Arachis hypogaea]